jgi:Fe-S cluster biogenesis protein NfuA
MTAPPASPIRRKLESIPFEEQVHLVLNEWCRPFMASDGGDIIIERISEKTVYVRLRGVCAGCSCASITLRNLVEEPMQAFIDPEIRVLPV